MQEQRFSKKTMYQEMYEKKGNINSNIYTSYLIEAMLAWCWDFLNDADHSSSTTKY